MSSEPVVYHLTESDIVAGNNLWRRSRSKMWRAIVAVLFLWAVCTSFVLEGFDDRRLGSIALAGAAAAVIVFILMAAMQVGSRWQSKRLTLRYFRDNRAGHQEIRLTWTQTHLQLEQDDGFQNRPWSDFRWWAEDDAVLVLLQISPIFHALPKRTFSEAQLADIRVCLADAGVSKAKLFPF